MVPRASIYISQKLLFYETYLQGKVNALNKYIRKMKQTAEEKEMENLFDQLVEGKSKQIEGLLNLLQTKLDELKKQLKKLRDGNVATETGANDSNGNAGEENDGHP